mmetsp:Transcript_2801/g.2625  ORF Transcript_2801/g.2625 Transcript_2801/m.2625 type:complete len:152 (+) Transcript_2801:963-1418(+)|eukprot:CAMPEP_0170552786 /NCGR_PEP_ID=MMETSP0211-20121228/10682_1 /TAXON_ID=311385 /ORGANISM="Pseudokeronopsis sp., Strain OXSARD2" /LENGTH=151 /DNA_ID=CAMNT_0010860775 /DNA_START=916 /DNA_END=1371 /DNA_ORIENTATION=+
MKGEANVCGEWLYNQEALQGYTLFCCQDRHGGLKDKPTKGQDFYHTCYALSGMSNSQYKSDYENLHGEEAKISEFFNGYYDDATLEVEEGWEEHKGSKQEPQDKTILLSGLYSNLLRRMNPIFNVRYDKLAKAKHYYYEKKMLTSPARGKE